MSDICNEIQQALSRHHDGEGGPCLDSAHLQECPNCAAFAAHLTRLQKSLRAAAPPFPDALRNKILLTTLTPAAGTASTANTASTTGTTDYPTAMMAATAQAATKVATKATTKATALATTVATPQRTWWTTAICAGCASFIILLFIGFTAMTPKTETTIWKILPTNAHLPADGLHLAPGDHVTLVGNANADRLHIWGGPAHLLPATGAAASHALKLISGQACFNWRSTPDHRFAILAQDLCLITKGTVFRVQMADNDHINVAVSEGALEIRLPDQTTIDLPAMHQWTRPTGINPTDATSIEVFNPIADPDFQAQENITVIEQ